ncbi:MAG: hypothetical protein L6Q60_16095 [Rhodocyclaceae bacterium]|nr:hypothetical protein [Rhodocyclaceae bacterium]
MTACPTCGNSVPSGVTQCENCCLQEGTETKNRTARYKRVVVSVAWVVVTLPFIIGNSIAAYENFAAFFLGHSLRTPSPFRIDLAGPPALIAGFSCLMAVAAFSLLAFARTRKYWPGSIALIVISFLVLNYVALPMRFAERSGR